MGLFRNKIEDKIAETYVEQLYEDAKKPKKNSTLVSLCPWSQWCRGAQGCTSQLCMDLPHLSIAGAC